MVFKLTTYKTLTGKTKILETEPKKSTAAIIYQDDKPAYWVDCFDLQTEANVEMNYLVLCQQKSMKSVIQEIAQKQNVNLYIKEAPLLSIKQESIETEMELPPLPLNWVN